jgi:hypothetical protein
MLATFRFLFYMTDSEKNTLISFSRFAAAFFPSAAVDPFTKTCVLCLFHALLGNDKFSNFQVAMHENMSTFLAPRMALAVKNLSETSFEALQPYQVVIASIRSRSVVASVDCRASMASYQSFKECTRSRR